MNQRVSTIGLPRMHKEPGEQRDFLPGLVTHLEKLGLQVVLEEGYGSGLGLQAVDYCQAAPGVRFAPEPEVYEQDYVLVLRCPRDQAIRWMRSGACLISMLHYPTRLQRVAFLRSQSIEAISLDSLKDDSGRRLVENLRAVAWNGMEAAFRTLQAIYPPPGFASPQRAPIQVTVLGAGAVGVQVVQAAIRYGDEDLRRQLVQAGIAGVRVNVVDFDLTARSEVMLPLLACTDILVDATQRPDPTQAVIPNAWIASLPGHAILVDLSVDPYDCDAGLMKGIEGIPQGNLDQYVFFPDDPAYERVPECIGAVNRRTSLSCYSWPGIYPEECMHVYGRQLQPILRTLFEKGGLEHIHPTGSFFERVINRGLLSRWP